MVEIVSSSKPSWWVSIIPFAVLITVLFFVIKYFGTDSLGGASQVALLMASGITIAISMLFYHEKWETFEKAICDNIRSVTGAILILIMIGALSGSWMVSGVVPTMIYYGMKIITPKVFLFASCLICALVSIMTGSSWTTIATIGVAIIGIGTGQGYEVGWIAGAIISGAYFGDKISPLSDTTVLASSSSGTPLFTHIRYMMITTVPSFTIASIIFLITSILHDAPQTTQMEGFEEALKDSFNISPWLMTVPLLTGVLIAKRIPAIITLFLGAAMAGVAAVIAQPHIVYDIAGGSSDVFNGLEFKDGFIGLMKTYYGATSIDTGNDMLNNLVSTRGMNGMLSTIFLIICALTFGGAMIGSGMIKSLTELMTKGIKKRTGLVFATISTGIFSNMVVADQYLSIILTSSLYKDLYQKNGYENRLLSRSTEDSSTVTSVLVPWNSCGLTQATVLGVPTIVYLPYCFFNLISPCMSILIAVSGYRIYKTIKE